MGVEIDFDSKNHYIQIKGELVATTVMDALKQLVKECREHPEWVLDFTRVTRVDSTALALLIELKRKAASNQRKIQFIYLPESLLTIARLAQIDDLLNTTG